MVKFTEAGFPIHDYIREMKEEREKREYKKAQKLKVEKADTDKHQHLAGVKEKRDILKCLKEEL